MKIKIPVLLLAFSMLFLFSCGQDEAGNEDIVVTKKRGPDKLKWATKTDPDGTIMRMHEWKNFQTAEQYNQNQKVGNGTIDR